MYPHERSLARHLADKPFAIIGVNSDRDLDSIRAKCVEKNITWRSFWNGEDGTGGPISKKWNVRGWPTTYLIDKDGVIRFKNVRGEALDKAITELLAEMGEEVSLADIDHEAEDEIAMAKLKADKAEPEAKDKPEDARDAADKNKDKAEDSSAAKTESKAADKESSQEESKPKASDKKEVSDKAEPAADGSGKDEAKDSEKDDVKKDETKEVKETKVKEDAPKEDAKASASE